MLTALREICLLRNSKNFELDLNNSNRYRLVVKENSGATAYCFSTPIYNLDSGKLVKRYFVEENEDYVFQGSNAKVTVHKNYIILSNKDGSITASFDCEGFDLHGYNLRSENMTLVPTFNGVSITVGAPSVKFTVKTDITPFDIRHSSKSFAVMKENFRPFFMITPIASSRNDGCFEPAVVSYSSIDECTYSVEISADNAEAVQFELNMYEFKLFQDTTVESRRPDENNAFGGMAFIGKTNEFGDQWLYSRPDLSKISELYPVCVKKILLHVPCLYKSSEKVSLFAPIARFCSFGSTWNNKIGQTGQLSEFYQNNNYLTVDLTEIMSDPIEKRIIYSEGLIVKGNGAGYAALSTADCYIYPQILEISYE